MPAQQITPEVKRDLRLIRLRGAMDTKRFYKSMDQTKFPKYFQFGTVVEGAADFYAGAALTSPQFPNPQPFKPSMAQVRHAEMEIALH